MRTTVDLPDDIHHLARQLAHETNRSMSDVVVDLIRRGLRRSDDTPGVSQRGMPLISVGRPVTSSDVLTLDDEV